MPVVVQFFDNLADVPVVQVLGGAAGAVPAGGSRDSEGASDSVHRRSQWTFQLCNRDGYAAFLRGYGGGEGFLRPFQAIFRAPPGRLELSASFRSPRW